MKIMIEVSGGVVTCITATRECSIYLIDHDNIRERGLGNPEDLAEIRRAMQPDCITREGDDELTPEFDIYVNEALSVYTNQ